MPYPEFYDRIPPISLYDPLADFLGATSGGTIEVRYLDAVRLAGHSCPTVAGAWLMAARALGELFGREIPVRGGIGVQMKDNPGDGVCGVIAGVFTLITGAAAGGGFEGLAGQYGRRDLLSFGHGEDAVHGVARFVRMDTGKAVTVAFDHSTVPQDPTMMPLLKKSLAGQATPGERNHFQELWTARVGAILTEFGDVLVSAHVEES